LFGVLDGFVRRRLRAILRKQDKRAGTGRCHRDHQRWPNTFFAARGLFTLCAAHAQARHSRCGNQRLESRVRENRMHGSEGGEGTTLPDPYRNWGDEQTGSAFEDGAIVLRQPTDAFRGHPRSTAPPLRFPRMPRLNPIKSGHDA
jgi:hypothetical protein